MNMEFLYQNALDTTTVITINSATDSAAYLFDRVATKQYASSGLNNDTTALSLDINFPATQTLNRIALQNINWKSFVIYYGGTTTNKLVLDSGNITSSSEFINNSATNLLLHFSSTVMTSLSIRVTTTMDANEEKKCGELWLNQLKYSMERNPSANNYDPIEDEKQIQHEMSDGGTVVLKVASKFKVDMKLSFIGDSFRDSLKDVYDDKINVFIPYPTGTSWDGTIYEVNWIENWDFLKPSKNYVRTDGWSGSIKLRETPI